MGIRPRTTVVTAAIIAVMLSLSPGATGANLTWTGGGSDDFWASAANWGGATPISNDNCIFSGNLRQVNTNDLVGLTGGWLRFNDGGFSLQ